MNDPYNLASLLGDAAKEYPDRTAVVACTHRLTDRKLDEAACQAAHVLRKRGVGRSDRVALTCPNVPAFPISYFAILKTGATVVPLNVLLKSREIAYHLVDSDAKAYLCFAGTYELPTGKEGLAAFREVDDCHYLLMLDDGDASGTETDAVLGDPDPDAVLLAKEMETQARTYDTAPTLPDDTAVILYTSGATNQRVPSSCSAICETTHCRASRSSAVASTVSLAAVVGVPHLRTVRRSKPCSCSIRTLT